MKKEHFGVKKVRFLFQGILVVVLLFSGTSLRAFELSKQSEISLLTCAPGNEAYAVYGHSAIRVRDANFAYDMVFNYGIFDFEKPNFLYRFAAGQTDYLLGAYSFQSFVDSYKRSERSIHEQVLELTLTEKQKIFDFLIWNAMPENRVYRYNFFFDNCATRVRDVIEANIDGRITYQEQKHSHKTLRTLTKDCHGKLPWLSFGVDFIVASRSDREASLQEEMFLPDYVMKHFSEAVKSKGNTPLVKGENVIFKASELEVKPRKITSPFVVFFVLTLFVFWFSYRQFIKEEMKSFWDYAIYGFNGFIGFVIAWFTLFSEHPAMSPNYNLLWALPLNLLFAYAWMVKKWRPRLKYYHVFIAVWLLLFLITSPFVPQYFHPVFYLFIIMLLSRSILHALLIFRNKKLG